MLPSCARPPAAKGNKDSPENRAKSEINVPLIALEKKETLQGEGALALEAKRIRSQKTSLTSKKRTHRLKKRDKRGA